MNKRRSWTPGLREANLLIYFVNLADNRGPDRRRPGPHPERISSRYIKALRSSELGSRFGAYSHPRRAWRLWARMELLEDSKNESTALPYDAHYGTGLNGAVPHVTSALPGDITCSMAR